MIVWRIVSKLGGWDRADSIWLDLTVRVGSWRFDFGCLVEFNSKSLISKLECVRSVRIAWRFFVSVFRDLKRYLGLSENMAQCVRECNTQHFLRLVSFGCQRYYSSTSFTTTTPLSQPFLSKANSPLRIYDLPTTLVCRLPQTISLFVCSCSLMFECLLSPNPTPRRIWLYTTIHGDADSMFNHSPGMDPKFDQFSRIPLGDFLETGVSVRQGEVAVVPHTAVAQPRHNK